MVKEIIFSPNYTWLRFPSKSILWEKCLYATLISHKTIPSTIIPLYGWPLGNIKHCLSSKTEVVFPKSSSHSHQNYCHIPLATASVIYSRSLITATYIAIFKHLKHWQPLNMDRYIIWLAVSKIRRPKLDFPCSTSNSRPCNLGTWQNNQNHVWENCIRLGRNSFLDLETKTDVQNAVFRVVPFSVRFLRETKAPVPFLVT